MTSDDQRGSRPAARPCPTCPYRRDAPSGLWAVHEYAKLPGYDGDIGSQLAAGADQLFNCHTDRNRLCAGWVGCHDMENNAAVRIHFEEVDLRCLYDYVSPVPLFASGTEAAAHGVRDIEDPDFDSRLAADKLRRIRKRRKQRERKK